MPRKNSKQVRSKSNNLKLNKLIDKRKQRLDNLIEQFKHKGKTGSR